MSGTKNIRGGFMEYTESQESKEMDSLRDIIIDMNYKLKVATAALKSLAEGDIEANPDHAKQIVTEALDRIK